MAQKTIQDLLIKCAKDQDFAIQVVNNPNQFKEEYELTEEQMASISGAGQAAAKVAKGGHKEYEDGGGGGGTGGGGGGNPIVPVSTE
jgi:uncharacterized membrane protein